MIPGTHDRETGIDLTLVRPRPDIRTFSGDFAAQSDLSLKYIMKKFLNLDSLTCSPGRRPNIYVREESSLVNFLEYALRVLFVKMDRVYAKNIFTMLVSFLKKTRFQGTIHIAYLEEMEPQFKDNCACIGMDKSGSNTTINLTYYNVDFYDEEDVNALLPHKKLIENAGDLIQYLILENFDNTGPYDVEKFGDIRGEWEEEDHLAYILRHCTSLKTLEIKESFMGNWILDKHVRNTSIERLIVADDDTRFPEPTFLSTMSTLLPGLKNLDINSCNVEWDLKTIIAPSICLTPLSTLFHTFIAENNLQ